MSDEPSVIDRFFVREDRRLEEIYKRSPMVTSRSFSSKKMEKVNQMRQQAKQRNFENLDEEE